MNDYELSDLIKSLTSLREQLILDDVPVSNLPLLGLVDANLLECLKILKIQRPDYE